MTKETVNNQIVYKEPYSQKDIDEMINKVRIEERYIANKVMGDFGIPASNRPPVYREAGDIIMNMILAPPKKPDEPDPATM